MRKLFFLMLTAFLMIQCGDDEVIPTPDNNSEDSFFNAKLDGVDFSATGIAAYALKDFDDPETTNIYGTANLGQTGEIIILIRVDDSGELNMEFQFDDENYWSSINEGDILYSSLPVVGGSGSVTITKRTDTEIAGSFSFISFNSEQTEMIEVTSGSFDVDYE